MIAAYQPDGDARPGGGRGGNALKERFLALDAFQSLYDDAYPDLFQQLYGSGTAADLLNRIAAVVASSDGLTKAQLAEQTATLRTFIQERTEALKDQVWIFSGCLRRVARQPAAGCSRGAPKAHHGAQKRGRLPQWQAPRSPSS